MATLLKCEQVLDSLEMAKPVSMSITITHGSWPVHLLVIVSFIGFHILTFEVMVFPQS